jgi:peroxiredoxin
LDALYRQFSPRGVHFVGVDERDSVSAGRAFVDEFHVPYPSLFDPNAADADAWLVAAAPAIFIVDAAGKIRGQFLGTLVGIDSMLAALLATKS